MPVKNTSPMTRAAALSDSALVICGQSVRTVKACASKTATIVRRDGLVMVGFTHPRCVDR